DPLVQKQCPFKKRPATNAPAEWVKPELVCEVSFTAWTADGNLRAPVFKGLREDKPLSEVRRETMSVTNAPVSKRKPKPTAANGVVTDLKLPDSSNGSMGIDGKSVRLTNLEKIYWPEDKYTKRDLIGYYAEIADFILPYLKDRPLSLLRHPNGIH